MDANNQGELTPRVPGSALMKRARPPETIVTPIADIFETADGFTVKLDMPGATKETISVTADPLCLAAKGVMAPRDRYEANLLLSEIGCKRYFREFNLGGGIKHDGIQAIFEDGILVISVPKIDEMKARQIQIR